MHGDLSPQSKVYAGSTSKKSKPKRSRWPKVEKFQAVALEMLRTHGKFDSNFLRRALPELDGKSDRELKNRIKDRLECKVPNTQKYW